MIEKIHNYYFSIKIDGSKKDEILNILKNDDISNYEKNVKYLYPEIYTRFNPYFKKLIDNEEIIIHKVKYEVFFEEHYNYITIYYLVDYKLKKMTNEEVVNHILGLTTANFLYKQSYLDIKENNSLKSIYNSDFRTVKDYPINTNEEKEKFEKIISIVDELSVLFYEQRERLKLYLLKNDNNVSKFLTANLNILLDIQRKIMEPESKEIIETRTFLFKRFSISKSITVGKTIDDKLNDEFTKNINTIESWNKLLSFPTHCNERIELENILNNLEKELLISLKERYTVFDMLLIDDFDKKIKKLFVYLSDVSDEGNIDKIKIISKTTDVLINFHSFYKEYNEVVNFIYKHQALVKKVEEKEVLNELENLKF